MTTSAELTAAVLALHAGLDAWHAAVEGVAAESSDNTTDALADPRLEAAQDSFYEALGVFEEATLPVLGLLAVDDEGDDEEDDMGQVLVDDFFVHLVVGVSRDDSPARLEEAFEMVHAAGHSVVDRLVTAGFVVPTFSASRGDLDLDLDEEEANRGMDGDPDAGGAGPP